VEGNRKAADRTLAERVREISRGTYQAPHELIDFDALSQAFLNQAKGTTRETTFKDYRGNLNRHLMPYFQGRKIREVRRTHVEDFRAHLLDKWPPDGQQVSHAARADVPLRDAA
ncbi:MAG: N-terminal phage integrase SAM-like domain-containing protein, partial [Gammaproteobacteria bacterium]